MGPYFDKLLRNKSVFIRQDWGLWLDGGQAKSNFATHQYRVLLTGADQTKTPPPS